MSEVRKFGSPKGRVNVRHWVVAAFLNQYFESAGSSRYSILPAQFREKAFGNRF